MKYIFDHAHLIIDGSKEYLDASLLVNDLYIEDVYPNANSLNVDKNEYQYIDCKGNIIMPGFFDSHCNGVDSLSFSSNIDNLEAIDYALLRKGAVSYLMSIKEYERIVKLDSYKSNLINNMGVHMDGPFTNAEYKDKVKQISDANLKKYLDSCKNIKQISLAYELDGAKDIGKLCHLNGIKVMCGYSDAVASDLDEELDGISNLFNYMKQLHPKYQTLANCAFSNKYQVELIGSIKNVEMNILKLVLNSIDRNKLMLVSADSDISILEQIKQLFDLGAKYTDLVLYSSLNAYKFYGLDKLYGSLVKGKCADIVILDKAFNVKNVLVKGKLLND